MFEKLVGLVGASDHPLIAAWFGLFFGIALVLGLIHESRIFADCLIVLVQHLKRECSEGRKTLRRLKQEFRKLE